MAYGQKLGFTVQELDALRSAFALHRDYQAMAWLNVAVDSMLRVSDLVRLTVVMLRRPDGSWRESFSIGMRKEDGAPVRCDLMPKTVEALQAYVTAYRLKDDDRLFPVSSKTLERTVKAWTLSLGLDPACYGCHSLRRTKASLMAENCTAQQLDLIRRKLGHKWLSSTQSYIGGDDRKASAFARAFDV
jgi:integrase